MRDENLSVLPEKSTITFDYTKMGVEIKPVQKMYARRTANENSIVHRHNYIEFFYVTDGEGVHIINGDRVTVKTGDACLLTMRDEHGFAVIPDVPFRHTDVMIDAEFFKQACDFFSPTLYDDAINGKLTLNFSASAEAQARLERFVPYLFLAPENPNYGLACKFIVTSIVSFLAESSVRKNGVNAPPPAWLSGLLTTLSSPENFTRSAAEITSDLAYNSDYVRRVFKSHIGMNITDYFNQCRMNQAYYLLEYSDMPIGEICYSVGIDNISYFYRLFRKTFRIPPGAVRK